MATTTTRKRRARKTTAKKTSLNTSTAKLPVSEVTEVPPRPEEEIADIVIETSEQTVVNVPPQTPTEPVEAPVDTLNIKIETGRKAILKDYPRDGLSLVLLPLLLLEAGVKEVLKATNTIK
tara:strand:+ start:288 stop:650 length:363 start_codon:yes stop_codon:yes gene_type:complete